MRKASSDGGHGSHGDLRSLRDKQIPSPVDSGFALGWLRLRRNVAGVAAVASLACSDASGPDALKPQDLSGVRRAARSGLVVVRDGAIDQADTHFAAEADVSVALTISSDTLIVNPLTGTLVYEFTLPPHSDSLQIEAGFDVYGNTHVNSYKLTAPSPDVAPGDELRASLSVNAVHTNVAGTGSPFVFDAGSGVMPPLSTESLGDVSNIPIDQFVGGGGGGGSGGGAGGGGPLMELRMPLASGVVQSGNERRTVDARGILHVREQVALESIKDLAAAGGTGSVTTERTYESAGDYWVLNTVAMRVEAVRGRTKVLSLSSLSLTRTRTFYNSRKAAERARRRRTRSSDLVSIETPLGVVTVNPCIARLQQAVDSVTAALRSDCGRSGGGPSGFGSAAIPIPACTSPFEHVASGAHNLLLVPGFQLNACSWSYVAPQINGVDGILGAVSVNTFASYADQAAAVMARVQAYGGSSGTRFVLIGNSMGGEVARLAAQTGPAIIRGTITVGSPNQGAPLVNNAPSFLSFANAVAFAVLPGVGSAVGEGLNTLGFLVPLFSCAQYPSMCDARPGSTRMQQINQAAAIPGAAVVYHASNNWLLYRTLGDMYYPARGAGYVRTVGAVYDNAVMCATVGAIFGSVFPGLLPAASQCAKLAAAVGGLDYLWQLAVSGGATSDGLIPVASQEWPIGGELRQYRVFNATAHGAEMRDSRTVVQIQRAFDDNFRSSNP